MANFWYQSGEYAKSQNQSVRFGDLVKPFGRKYKGMWRVFGTTEAGEIMLISDECINECTLKGEKHCVYFKVKEILDNLCADIVKSSKVKEIRSINLSDLWGVGLDKERYQRLRENLFQYDCWTATSYWRSEDMGIHVICDKIIKDKRLYLRDTKEEYEYTLGVRAIAVIKKDVQFTKTKDGYWKI